MKLQRSAITKLIFLGGFMITLIIYFEVVG
jgi:hypothetical protein